MTSTFHTNIFLFSWNSPVFSLCSNVFLIWTPFIRPKQFLRSIKSWDHIFLRCINYFIISITIYIVYEIFSFQIIIRVITLCVFKRYFKCKRLYRRKRKVTTHIRGRTSWPQICKLQEIYSKSSTTLKLYIERIR